MSKSILILNLIVKSLVEIIFVIFIIGTIGVVFFSLYYVFYTINKSVADYYKLKDKC